MIFYKYTLNKMFKSVSTYITGVFGVLPVLVLGIMAMAGNGTGYSITSLVIMATFPLFVVFITFKTVQVFRDEIENQTMLTIVSKPFPRKKLVLEGLLSLFTVVALAAFIGLFIPMLGYLRTESNGGEVFLKALLVTLTTILLGSIIASLGMLLSLKMKGKSFIGIMLAIFGVGFYALWGTMIGLRFSTSRANKINTFNTQVGVSVTSKEGTGFQNNGKWLTYKIVANKNLHLPVGSNYNVVQEAKNIYEQFKELNNLKAMDVINWIDPTLHWQVLYNGAASFGNGENSLLKLITNGADVNVEIKDDEAKIDEVNGIYEFEAKITPKSIIPIYYPIILWLLIGGVVIGLSFRTLNKSNIS